MTDLLYTGADNVGSLIALRFAPVGWLQSLPLLAEGQAGVAVFKDTYSWREAYGSPETKQYEEIQEDSDHGPVWSVTFGLFLPGDSPARRGQLAQMTRLKFVVEGLDMQNLRRRGGTFTEGLTMSYNYKSGGSVSDRPGYTIKFTGQLTAPPPIVS